MARVVRIALLLFGAGLLALLLTQIDLRAVGTHLSDMGWALPLIFLPSLSVYLCDAVGWKFAFGHPPLMPFRTFFLIRTAGEAINNLTPFAYMGGEPVKAHLLTRFQIPMLEGMAATLTAKLIMTMAQVIFIILGGILAAPYLVGRQDILWALGGIIAGAGVLLAGLWYGLQVGVFARLLRGLDRWKPMRPRLERWRKQLLHLDQLIAVGYRDHPRRLLWSFSYYLLGWLLGALEVLAIFYAVGLPIGPGEALAIEALASVAKGIAAFIPGSLGVQEGGNVLILVAFGLTSGLGLTFSLLRRVRELVWISVGLLVLLYYYGWPRARPSAPERTGP